MEYVQFRTESSPALTLRGIISLSEIALISCHSVRSPGFSRNWRAVPAKKPPEGGTTNLIGQRHFESPIRHKILFRLTLRHSTFPSPPKSGEKVADRPDEGPVQDVNLRKKPPHPSPLPQFVCDHTAKKNHAISANKSGERGQSGAVHLLLSETRKRLPAVRCTPTMPLRSKR